jgi:hypothetical protein
LGLLATRLAWTGPGWGIFSVTGPEGAGLTRLVDEVALRSGTTPVRIVLAPEDAPVGEPLRRALLELLGDGGRRTIADRLARALGGSAGEAGGVIRWLLDGPEAGVAMPGVETLRHVLRACVTVGPLLVDDYDRLDEPTRRLVVGEGGRGGVGVLATARPDHAPGPDVHGVVPLGRAQVELLLRRWLRHPVTVRRLAPRVFERSEGWPGRVVRIVRGLGRNGSLAADARGIRIAKWPPAWPERGGRGGSFHAYAASLTFQERSVLEASAVLGSDEDPVLLARAAGVKRRLVEDLQVDVRERWPEAGRGLFPSRADRAALVGGLEEGRRRDLGERIVRAWSRQDDPAPGGVREGAARLRAALASEDPAATAEAREALALCLPDGVPTGAPVVRLLAEADAGPAPAPRPGARAPRT